METISNILSDSLNGFSPRYIPLFLFQLLCAGFLGMIFQWMINKKFKERIVFHGTLMALGIALLVALTKNSLPFSVIAAALILVLGLKGERTTIQVIGLFIILLIGIGCGIGSIIQTFIGTALLACVLLFLPLKDETE